MKNFIALLLFSLLSVVPIAAVEVSVGLNGSTGFGGAYKGAGQYEFTGGTGNTSRAVTLRPLWGGDIAGVVQLSFTGWYALMPEIGYSFKNGLRYGGHTWASHLPPSHADLEPLTGEMDYSYKAININILNKFTFFNTGRISTFAIVGPALSVTVGDVREHFRPSLQVGGSVNNNAPYDKEQKRYFAPENRFNAGLAFGFGFETAVGPGFINFDVRSTWYFTPNFKTHYSQGNSVFSTKPVSLSLGYLVKLSSGDK